MAKILIVDDEPDMRSAIRNVLALRGYELSEAGDGPSALNVLNNDKIDLMLLDIRLPGMDGIEVLERARQLKPGLPVIMITGYGHIQSAVDVMKLGAGEYLQKPFENAQLVDAVRKFTILEKPEPSAENGPSSGRFIPFRLGFKKSVMIFCAVVLAAVGFKIVYDNLFYRKSYRAAGAGISSLMWSGDDLWTNDWVSRSVYRYGLGPDGLVLKRQYLLKDSHISAFAVSGERFYVCDSWKKTIEIRLLDDSLSLVKTFPSSGKIVGLFYDGEYLWACASDGTVSLHRPDDELSRVASFKLTDYPDLVYRDSSRLWSAVSVSGKLYRHSMDDKLSIERVYRIKDFNGQLSAFAWRNGRLWLARAGSDEILELGKGWLSSAK